MQRQAAEGERPGVGGRRLPRVRAGRPPFSCTAAHSWPQSHPPQFLRDHAAGLAFIRADLMFCCNFKPKKERME